MNEFVARNGLISLASASITGSLDVTGSGFFAGNVSIGGNPVSTATVFQVGGGSVSPSAGSSGFLISFGGTMIEAGSSHHDIFATVGLFPHTQTGGTATMGSVATLYVSGEPSATVNEDRYTAFFAGRGIKVQGKLIGTGSGATIAAGAAAGTTPTVNVFGGDLAGVANVTIGTSPPASGTLITITFTSVFKNAPIVILTPINTDTCAKVSNYYVTSTTGNFSILINTTFTTGVKYEFNYMVIGQ